MHRQPASMAAPHRVHRESRYLLLAVAVGGLAGCGPNGGDGVVASLPSPTTASSTAATPSPSGAPGTSSPATTATTAVDASAGGVVGGARPVGATQITTFQTASYGGERIATVKSPSGNVGCDFYASGKNAGCGVISLKMEHPSSSGPGYPWWVSLTGTLAEVEARGDAPYYEYNNPKAQVVAYGSSVYDGDYACTSTEAEFICWNTATGVGARMSRAGIVPFKGPQPAAAATSGPAAAATSGPAAAATSGSGSGGSIPTLGIAGLWPDARGFGQVKPAMFSTADLGGAARATDITWSSWGGPTADGSGQARNFAKSPNNAVMAPTETARIRAYDLGDCKGQTVYRKVEYWFPQSGQTFTGKGTDICTG